MIYNVYVDNDMGHLIVNITSESGNTLVPNDIKKFVYEKINMYVNCATDKNNSRFRFYVLKDELSENWIYYYGNNKIYMKYSLNIFNPNDMKICDSLPCPNVNNLYGYYGSYWD